MGWQSDSRFVGYRIVWAYRNRVATEMANFLGRIGRAHDDKFNLNRHRRIEESIWEILQQRPVTIWIPHFPIGIIFWWSSSKL